MRHVRDRQRYDLCALTGAGQPTALDPRQMLSDGVDLADRRARAQQRPVDLLFLRERDAIDRRDPVGGASARQQHQQEIVGPGLRGETQAVFRALQAGLVGHGMAGLHHPDPPRRHAVAVAGGGDAGEPDGIEFECIEIVPLRGGRQRCGALAGGETNDAPFRYRTQMPRQHHSGMRGGNRGVEHGAQERASVGHAVTGCV